MSSWLLHQRNKPQQHEQRQNLPSNPCRTFNICYSRISLHLFKLIILLSLVIILIVFLPTVDISAHLISLKNRTTSFPNWKDYTLAEASSFVAKDGTVIVCAVSQPYLPFLSNWLISVSRQKHQEKVLVIAEDYATLYEVNQKWPGHAVLIPPAPDTRTEHEFGSKEFLNLTTRRPRHLLQILELGYNVMYNDVDMVWLADPFPYLQGDHDVYFTDDVPQGTPSNHSSHLLPGKNYTNICSCMIFLRPSSGAKLVLKKWIEELQVQQWSKEDMSNDQPPFNKALSKTAGQVDLCLLPQTAFPPGCLYFYNQTWAQGTKGFHVIVHNNYIIGFQNKMKRFHDFGLWLVDDHALESPLGKLEQQD